MERCTPYFEMHSSRLIRQQTASLRYSYECIQAGQDDVLGDVTSALDGGELSNSHPGRFNPPRGKNTQYPQDGRLGGPHSRPVYGGKEKNPRPLPGIETRSYSPYPSRYTDWVIPTPHVNYTDLLITTPTGHVDLQFSFLRWTISEQIAEVRV
jgi:hypothetical protein